MPAIQAKHRTINRKQNIPDIRFAGFKNEWEEVSFGDLFQFKQTNSFSRDDLNYEQGKVKNIHYGDIHIKFGANFDVVKEIVPFINTDIDISNIKKDNYCIEGDLVIADASEDYEDVGKAIEIRNLNNEKVVAGLHTLLARPVSESFAPGFLGYLMRSKTVRHQIKILAQGTKVLGIAPRYLSEVLFKIPSKEEQQRITSFLESIDDLLGNLRIQRKYLNAYKIGMMQKIFSQEIRFKDKKGEDFPEWEDKRLGDICEKESSHVSANSLDDNNGEYKIYGASGLLKKIDFYNEEQPYISIVKDGAGVGRLLLCDAKSSVLGTLDIIKPKTKVNLYFLYLTLGRVNFIKYVIAGTIPHIYFKDYKKVKITLASFPEQQMIADFFSAIDKIIENKNRQIHQVAQWKKGLMQQLFI